MQLHVCGSMVVQDFCLLSFGRVLPCMCLLLCPRKPLQIHPSSNFTTRGIMMGFCDYTVSWQMQTIDTSVFVFYSLVLSKLTLHILVSNDDEVQ
jgi:hypothetical protein